MACGWRGSRRRHCRGRQILWAPPPPPYCSWQRHPRRAARPALPHAHRDRYIGGSTTGEGWRWRRRRAAVAAEEAACPPPRLCTPPPPPVGCGLNDSGAPPDLAVRKAAPLRCNARRRWGRRQPRRRLHRQRGPFLPRFVHWQANWGGGSAEGGSAAQSLQGCGKRAAPHDPWQAHRDEGRTRGVRTRGAELG